MDKIEIINLWENEYNDMNMIDDFIYIFNDDFLNAHFNESLISDTAKYKGYVSLFDANKIRKIFQWEIDNSHTIMAMGNINK